MSVFMPCGRGMTVEEFMKARYIPEGRIDSAQMSPQQILYERELFRKRLGTNNMGPNVAYNNGVSSAKRWAELSGGRRPYKVLDIGCGEGYDIHFMNGAGITAIGLNLSVVEAELAAHGRIDEITKLMMWDGSVNRDVAVGSTLSMPFPAESFDGVASSSMLCMVPYSERLFGSSEKPIESVRKVVKESFRVLKPGGLLDISTLARKADKDPVPGGYGFTLAFDSFIGMREHSYDVYDDGGYVVESGNIGLRDLLEDAGFKVQKLKINKEDVEDDEITDTWETPSFIDALCAKV